MDDLVKAAQEEGELNVIALPAGLGQLRQDHLGVRGQVRHQGQLRPARRRQPGRDQRRQPAQGHRPRARRLRPRPVRRPRQHRHVRAVQGADLGRHPRRVQGPGRRLGQRLRRLHVRSATTPARSPTSPRSTTCSAPSSRARSPSTATRPQAGAAFSGVVMASVANGGSADDIAPGVEYFRKLKDAGNFLPVDPTPATIESGQTPVVIDWDYLNAAETAKLAELEGLRPGGRRDRRLLLPGDQRRRAAPRGGPALAGVPLQRRGSEPLARRRRPPGARRRDGRGRHDRPGAVRRPARRSRATPVIPTNEQTEKMAAYLADNWAKAVG